MDKPKWDDVPVGPIPVGLVPSDVVVAELNLRRRLQSGSGGTTAESALTSTDRDFARFRELTWRNPLSPNA